MIDIHAVLNLAHESSDINEYLMTLYTLIVEGKYKTVVELGVGRSTIALCAAVNATDGQLYSFDLFESSLLRSGEAMVGELKKESRFHFSVQDDMEVDWKKPIDFLFLDTSHEYDHTKKEIDKWFPLVRSRGMIFMHDTGSANTVYAGCRKALDEFITTSIGGSDYVVVHLMDTKMLGGTVLVKL